MAVATDERAEVRDALIAAAQRLLGTGARYPEITVQQLCDEAGITRWRFYKHFRDKHEVLRSWFAELNLAFETTHDVWLQIDHRPTEAELRHAVGELFRPYAPQGALHAAMYDSAAVDPAIRAEVDDTERQRMKRLAAHIERGQRDGFIGTDILAVETAEWIIATGSRGFRRMVGLPDGISVDQFIESFARYAWFVLYAPAEGE